MSKMPNYVVSSNWYKEVITCPTEVIKEAFSNGTVYDYKGTITGIFLHVFSKRIYRKQDPGTVLFHCKMIESLINAAYVISKDNEFVILEPHQGGRHEQWNCFADISVEEFANPGLVFSAFFRYQKIGTWKKNFLDIMESALSTDDVFFEIDTYVSHLHLTKLVDAMQILYQRQEIMDQLKALKISLN